MSTSLFSGYEPFQCPIGLTLDPSQLRSPILTSNNCCMDDPCSTVSCPVGKTKISWDGGSGDDVGYAECVTAVDPLPTGYQDSYSLALSCCAAHSCSVMDSLEAACSSIGNLDCSVKGSEATCCTATATPKQTQCSTVSCPVGKTKISWDGGSGDDVGYAECVTAVDPQPTDPQELLSLHLSCCAAHSCSYMDYFKASCSSIGNLDCSVPVKGSEATCCRAKTKCATFSCPSDKLNNPFGSIVTGYGDVPYTECIAAVDPQPTETCEILPLVLKCCGGHDCTSMPEWLEACQSIVTSDQCPGLDCSASAYPRKPAVDSPTEDACCFPKVCGAASEARTSGATATTSDLTVGSLMVALVATSTFA